MRETPAIGRLLSVEEYLRFEEQSPISHEYIGGEVFAMAGVTTRHNLITLNLALGLRSAARRRGCRTFATDVKLRAAPDRIYYPDLMVACGKAAAVDLIVEAPSVVVEVTSPSTRATDRREKLDAYQRIAALRTYLIVEQRFRRVLVYSRDANDAWVRQEFGGNGTIAIPALDASITLDEIYDDVPMPPLIVGEEELDWGEDELDP